MGRVSAWQFPTPLLPLELRCLCDYFWPKSGTLRRLRRPNSVSHLVGYLM
jgi:hypothetical protein